MASDYPDANVFMRPFEIYRAALYNVYGGSRVTDVPYIIIYGLRVFVSSGSLKLFSEITVMHARLKTATLKTVNNMYCYFSNTMSCTLSLVYYTVPDMHVAYATLSVVSTCVGDRPLMSISS